MENSISSSQTELAQSIYDSFIENNKTCSGAPQQQVNGAYRMFELLYLISMELDYTGNWNDFTSSILSDYETFNSNASGAPCPQGSYVWKLSYKALDRPTSLRTEIGTVLLIR